MSTPPSPDNAVAAHGCFAAAGAGQAAAGEGVQTLYVLRHGGDKDRVAARAFVIPGLHVQHGGRADAGGRDRGGEYKQRNPGSRGHFQQGRDHDQGAYRNDRDNGADDGQDHPPLVFFVFLH